MAGGSIAAELSAAVGSIVLVVAGGSTVVSVVAVGSMAAVAEAVGSIVALAAEAGSIAAKSVDVPGESSGGLTFLPLDAVGGHSTGPCVAIVRTAEEFSRALRDPVPGVEWIQVEGLISDPDVWAMAAQGTGEMPLDVVLDDPAAEFSALYRLVDVRLVRPVRVTMPARSGFLKALRLAAAVQIPVRLLPGQPGPEILAELTEAAEFYLRDPAVEVPVEFFHSVLMNFRGQDVGVLWVVLEQDPEVFVRVNAGGDPVQAADFVENHWAGLVASGAECVDCRWQGVCGGYFKWPDPGYSCSGVKELFALLEGAAEEIGRDLSGLKVED